MLLDLKQVRNLMEVFDRFDSLLRHIGASKGLSHWQPCSDMEKAAFEALTDPQNRAVLKRWYQAGHSINPHADDFRRMLEQATGDKLPIANPE